MIRDGGRTLWLHVGHGKTGSSYLQSLFAVNREPLAAQNVAYPAYRDDETARAGGVTVGNAPWLRLRLRRRITATATGLPFRLGRSDVLLSNETMMNALSRRAARRNLMRFADAGGFRKIRVLAFIRDPDEHFLSFWGQMIRSEGETRGIDQLIDAYPTPHRVARFLRGMAEEPRVTFAIRNYSRVRATLAAEVAAWIGLRPEALTEPPVAMVNRSLCLEELAVQRALNMKFARCGGLYADRAISRPAPQDGTKPRLTKAQRDRLFRAVRRPMRQVDALTPPEHRYRMEAPTAEAPFDMSLDAQPAAFRAEYEAALP